MWDARDGLAASVCVSRVFTASVELPPRVSAPSLSLSALVLSCSLLWRLLAPLLLAPLLHRRADEALVRLVVAGAELGASNAGATWRRSGYSHVVVTPPRKNVLNANEECKWKCK